MEQPLETVLGIGIALQYAMFTIVIVTLPLITVALINIQTTISRALKDDKRKEGANENSI